MTRAPHASSGFSMLELLFAASIGLLVIAGAVSLFTQALKATWVTSQKSEMQQDFRSAANLLQRDISMAGAGALGQQGIGSSAVGLPTGGATLNPIYPCSATACNFVNGGAVAFPNGTGAPYLYSIIPGPSLGITVPGSGTGASDILTIVTADVSLALNCYTGTIDPTGTVVTFTVDAGPPYPSTCILPTGTAAPQALNDPNVGLKAGDMIAFGTKAVGVVTNIAAGAGGSYVVSFAATDPGHVNQPGATSGSLFQFVSTTRPTPASTPISVTAVRLLTVTYYLDISPSDGVTPRLMRIQNGKTPAPVAENVVNLKFTYNVNNNGVISANQATLPAGTTPAMITQVNVAHLSMRSQLPGSTGYQGLDLQTSISARNLSSQQEYPIQGSAY